jgi:hypothetical protein
VDVHPLVFKSFLKCLKAKEPFVITAKSVDFLLATAKVLEFSDLRRQCEEFKRRQPEHKATLRSLSSSYHAATARAVDGLDQGFNCLSGSVGATPSESDVDEARSACAAGETDIVAAEEIDRQISELCRSSGLSPRATGAPTIAALHNRSRDLRLALERAMQEAASRIVERPAPIKCESGEPEAAPQRLPIWTLNPGMDPSKAERIDAALGHRTRPTSLSEIDRWFPNLGVRRGIPVLAVPTAEAEERARALTSDIDFSVDCSDRNAAIHVFSAVAQHCHLTLACAASDRMANPLDVAMASGVVNGDSLSLLGSNRPEHQAKGIYLVLNPGACQLDQDGLPSPEAVVNVRGRLAEAHSVDPSQIVLVELGGAPPAVSYTVRSESSDWESLAPLPDGTDALEQALRRSFGTDYYRHYVHPSFAQLQVDEKDLDLQWNLDFRRAENCRPGQTRAGRSYCPPKGWQRFGIKVTGRFDGGNDAWLGCVNGVGEWAVAYHGTSFANVGAIVRSPLHVGPRNDHGYGIYCSPNPDVAQRYTDRFPLEDRSGSATYQFMFVCRVNVSRPHQCTQIPCPEDHDPQWTVHMNQQDDYWFVNPHNEGYETIRTYGILVQKVDSD